MHSMRKILSAGTHGIQERLQVQFGKQRELSDKYSFQGGSIPIHLPNKNAAITNRDKCLERNGSIFVYWGAEFYISNTPIITIPAKVTAMQA